MLMKKEMEIDISIPFVKNSYLILYTYASQLYIKMHVVFRNPNTNNFFPYVLLEIPELKGPVGRDNLPWAVIILHIFAGCAMKAKP